MTRCAAFATTFVIASLLLPVSDLHAQQPCVQQIPTLSQWCRFSFNAGGQPVTKNLQVNLPLDGNLIGPLSVGNATKYNYFFVNQNGMAKCPCANLVNCEGDCCSYATVSIANTFSINFVYAYEDPAGFVFQVPLTINKDRVNDYYDHMYEGYTPEGDVDFSQNCHGYAYGIGNWTSDGSEYAWGIGKYINPPFCYEAADPSTATQATANSHSIKTSGEMCNTGEFEVIMDFPQITATSEKCRSSRVYTLTIGCGMPVNLGSAFGMSTGDFTLYKQSP